MQSLLSSKFLTRHPHTIGEPQCSGLKQDGYCSSIRYVNVVLVKTPASVAVSGGDGGGSQKQVPSGQTLGEGSGPPAYHVATSSKEGDDSEK